MGSISWGDVATWAGTAAAVIASTIALVFGIRAERREAYRPLWVLPGNGTAVNRTGEDARNVLVFLEEPDLLTTMQGESVPPNGVILLEKKTGNVRRVFIAWVRPSTERMYYWPRSARRRTRRLRQHHRGVMAEHRAAARRSPQLGDLSDEAIRRLRWRHWRP